MEPDIQDKTPELHNCLEGLHLTLVNVPVSFFVSAREHGAEFIVLGRVQDGKKWGQTTSLLTGPCSPLEHKSTTPHKLFVTSLAWACSAEGKKGEDLSDQVKYVQLFMTVFHSFIAVLLVL